MKIRFKHTNIVAGDWQRLASFYREVFQCVPMPPERHLAGEWLARGTGVEGARFAGVRLLLPGGGEGGPTLEIYQYDHTAPRPLPAANREGLAHIAFEVEDVGETLATVLRFGGAGLGEVVSHEVEGVGLLTFVYALDPEGNIVELQHWD